MRLIDADALKELILAERDKIPKKVPCATYELMREKDNQHGNAMRGGIRVALRCMENTPTIEAEPVQHGRWQKAWDYINCRYYHQCSECGWDAIEKAGSMYTEVLSYYCPYCGAKMDGGVGNAK